MCDWHWTWRTGRDEDQRDEATLAFLTAFPFQITGLHGCLASMMIDTSIDRSNE
jgi:hypothetical protein